MSCQTGKNAAMAAAVGWPDGDIVGTGLEGHGYPHPVKFIDVVYVAQAELIDREAPD